jgi:hypothetical protein
MTRYLEILGKSVTMPDPDVVASMSASYYGMCNTIAEAKAQLTAIGSPQSAAQWHGQAADTFATRLGSLPGQLEQAWQSYNDVARALSGYASNLRPVIAALNSLVYQAEEAEGTLRATQSAREQAVRAGQPQAGVVWDARLSEAQGAVALLTRRLSVLLAELGALSADCVKQIQQAQPAGVHESLFGDLKRYLVDAGGLYWRAEKDVFHFDVTVAKDIYVRPFTDLYDDAKKWNWHKLGTVLDDISGVLGVLAIVCAPVPGLDAALAIGAIGFGVLGAGADIVAASEHEKDASWGDVAFDVAGVALMGSGRIVGQGVKFAKLADGPDAELSAKAVWKAGIGHFRDLPDVDPAKFITMGDHTIPVYNPVTTYQENIKSYLNLGVEENAAPARVPYQHAEFTLDRVGDGLTVVHDELNDLKGNGS